MKIHNSIGLRLTLMDLSKASEKIAAGVRDQKSVRCIIIARSIPFGGASVLVKYGLNSKV